MIFDSLTNDERLCLVSAKEDGKTLDKIRDECQDAARARDFLVHLREERAVKIENILHNLGENSPLKKLVDRVKLSYKATHRANYENFVLNLDKLSPAQKDILGSASFDLINIVLNNQKINELKAFADSLIAEAVRDAERKRQAAEAARQEAERKRQAEAARQEAERKRREAEAARGAASSGASSSRSDFSGRTSADPSAKSAPKKTVEELFREYRGSFPDLFYGLNIRNPQDASFIEIFSELIEEEQYVLLSHLRSNPSDLLNITNNCQNLASAESYIASIFENVCQKVLSKNQYSPHISMLEDALNGGFKQVLVFHDFLSQMEKMELDGIYRHLQNITAISSNFGSLESAKAYIRKQRDEIAREEGLKKAEAEAERRNAIRGSSATNNASNAEQIKRVMKSKAPNAIELQNYIKGVRNNTTARNDAMEERIRNFWG